MKVMIKSYMLVVLTVLLTMRIEAQNPVIIGDASYAEYPIPAVENTDFYGMSWAYLRDGYPFSIHANMQGQPVPTNDWWTDMLFENYGGNLWAYPHAVSTDNQGLNVIFPNATEGNGMSTATQFELKGSAPGGNTIAFTPAGASPKRWSDIDVEFRMAQSGTEYMDVTIAHGVPYVWAEFSGIEPVLDPNAAATVYNTSGGVVSSFPATMSTFVMAIDGKYFGIHAAAGTVVSNNGGNYFLNTPDGSNYVVISMLPDQSFINTYDTDARNKITNTTFSYNYDVSGGAVSTTFDIATENLDNAVVGGNTIMSFLPHHWRETTKDFSFIANADYTVYIGQMHSAIGNSFTMEYPYGGMLPSMPEPLTLTQTQQDRLYDLITDVSIAYAYAGDTYNKGLDEVSELMMVAHELGHPRYTEFKESVKSVLNSWLTFDPAVDDSDWSQFFAFYPDYGGLIGFRPGYGSQGFNDLHFHYGYYVLAGARLCMVDEEFKAGYEGILRLLAKTYANHKRYGVDDTDFYPWLRTFDPYAGHSWAGGTSSANGNNQESLSEAIMSWFGVYNLGVALNDPELIEVGVMGYNLETRAGKEYWFDITGENFPPTYGHEYVGIFQAASMAHATYFSGDPGWVMGIHFVPSGHYMSHYGDDPVRQEEIWNNMLNARVANGDVANTDYYTNIENMGPYLGGFHLGHMSQWDPVGATAIADQLYANNWHMDGNPEPSRYGVLAINTTYTNATYGHPAEGYSTSSPTGAVYEAADGTIITVIQNWTDQDQDVNVYNNGTLVETITVKAGKTYNSLAPGPFAPTVQFLEPTDGDRLSSGETFILEVYANDKDGFVESVEFFVNGISVGTAVEEPFQVSYSHGSAETLNIYAVATDDDGTQTTSETIQVSVEADLQSPYNAAPWDIPGTITAWQYDIGGEGIAYHDTDAANSGAPSERDAEGVDIEAGNPPNIGWTAGGEWVEYTVNVASTGVYDVTISKASMYGEGILHLELDRNIVTESVAIEGTGDWAAYNTQTFPVTLEEGEHVLRLYFENQGVNLRTMSFAFNTTTNIASKTSQDEMVKIYPNPIVDQLIIECKAVIFNDLMIVDIAGNQLYRQKVTNDELVIDMSHFRNGIYMIKLVGDANIETRVIFKQ